MTIRAKSISTLALLALTAFMLVGCDMEVPEQVFKEGLDAYQKQGNFIHALVQFDKFLDKYPNHEWAPSVWLYKANCHWQLNQMEKALEACNQVIADYPGTNKAIEARFLKSRIHASQQNWDEAVQVCRDLMEDMGHVGTVYQNAAMQISELYVQSRQWDNAVEVYDEMIASASVDEQMKPSLYIYKGRSLVEAASPEMALESFSALQSHYPGSEEAIWAKIETARLKKKENEEQGRALLEQAIEDYKQRQKDLADQLAAATGTLQTQGFQGMQPSVSTEDLAKIDIESKIASAYSYLGYHEEALARLEEIKSQYLHEPRIYQYLNSQIEMLRAQQEPEEEIIHGATEEAGTAAAAPIGSVSP